MHRSRYQLYMLMNYFRFVLPVGNVTLLTALTN